MLTFTTLLANSADDDKLMKFNFPENRIWHFMQIVYTGDNLNEISKSVLSGKNKKKLFQNVVCWIFFLEY